MRSLTLLSLLAFGCLLLTGCPAPKPWQGTDAREYGRLNEHRLIGIAHVENDRKDLALPEFEAIRKAEPALAFGHVNAAVSLLKARDRLAEAQKAAEEAVKRQPELAWPQVVLGKVLQTAGKPDAATAAFEKAVSLAPKDPRVLGALAKQLQSIPGDHSARLNEVHRMIADVAPDSLAAQADWLLAQADMGDSEGAARTLQHLTELLPGIPANVQEPLAEARKAVAAGMEMERRVRGLVNVLKPLNLFTQSYGELYGNERDPADLIMREWDVPPPASALAEPPLDEGTITWKDVTAATKLGDLTVSGVAPVAMGDIDLSPETSRQEGDRVQPVLTRPDLVMSPVGMNAWLNQGAAFSRSGASFYPGAPASSGGAPLLTDLNNDFTLDLYLADPAGDRLWMHPRSGKTPKTGAGLAIEGTGTAGKPVPIPAGKGPGTATAVDLDQDGDLDILRASSAPGQPAVRYLRNNGNATFTDLTAAADLNLPSAGARQAVFADFDADGDPDFFIARAQGPSQLFLNRRQDVFRNASEQWGLKSDPGAMSAAVLDFDRDGDWDIAVAGRSPHGSILYRNDGGKFTPDAEALAALGGGDWDWVQVLDYDNDSRLDLAFAGTGGVRLLRSQGGSFTDGGTAVTGAATWVKAFDYDQDGDLDLLAALSGGKLRLLSNEGGNSHPWLTYELQGNVIPSVNANGKPNTETQANNSYGIGAVVEPRTLWDRQPILVTEPQTHIGLGRAERPLAIRVLWTHGVPENELRPPANTSLHFKMTPRGSCPFLYVWNGEEWVFACDFNWKSPLGMLFARGAPIPHDQTLDWVKLPAEQMKPVGGYYPLIATEELREVAYFDQIRLLAVDHPAETEVYVDERFKMGPPDPFRIHTATHRRLPVSAKNDAGEDLLPALKAVDRVYTPVPPGPYRGVRAPHDLVLDLGDVPDPARVKLFLHGWIYPAGTSTNVATGQDPTLKIIPPTLYVGDGKGGWVEADRNVGLPCGKRKTMVLDLGNRFRGRDFRVKLTTTMEIRWDAAFYTSGEKPAAVRQSELPLAEADLRERGYGTRYREVEDGPDLFDYNRPLPPGEPGWPDIAGAYSKLGDCAPLLRNVDDRYAIVAPGDEIRMQFDARKLPPLPAGWKRDFILLSDGWTKDSDPNTVTGEQVGPLPFHGMKRYPYGPEERFPDTPAHRRWRKEWNTRVKGREPQSLGG